MDILQNIFNNLADTKPINFYRRDKYMEESNKIVKVRKNEDGDISSVMMEDGTVIPIDEAIRMTKSNKIQGVNVGRSKSGTEYLRSDPDGIEENNLEQLPTF